MILKIKQIQKKFFLFTKKILKYFTNSKKQPNFSQIFKACPFRCDRHFWHQYCFIEIDAAGSVSIIGMDHKKMKTEQCIKKAIINYPA